MALALGLGSLFNHAEVPNVSFTLDPATESIRYTVMRPVRADDELCIFYGPALWFEPVALQPAREAEALVDDGWGGLSALGDEENNEDGVPTSKWMEGDPGEIVLEEDLPFTRLKITQEEEMSAVRTSMRSLSIAR